MRSDRPFHPDTYRSFEPRRGGPYREDYEEYTDASDRSGLWLAAGVGALAGAAGIAWWTRRRLRDDFPHPADSAPPRTARQGREDGRVVAGRTVTIAKPRAEVYAFWRDFGNLPSFMENIDAVVPTGERTHRWSIRAVGERTVELDTRIEHERENESLAWRSIEGSDIEARGEVSFRDAPAGRGTEVLATIVYSPPAGELGRLVLKLFRREPGIQVRHELKRLKMLLETGEIATSDNRRPSSAPA